ncbi:MAG: hypothetical protein GF411_14485 [Candidatus Lokiarchaeota archaeon]|nr:hypothetical protein [Candidatus Lokiarchaeota archaeon]
MSGSEYTPPFGSAPVPDWVAEQRIMRVNIMVVDGYNMIKALNSIGMFTGMNSTVGLNTESRIDRWIEENANGISLYKACIRFLDTEAKDFDRPQGYEDILKRATGEENNHLKIGGFDSKIVCLMESSATMQVNEMLVEILFEHGKAKFIKFEPNTTYNIHILNKIMDDLIKLKQPTIMMS